VIAGKEGATEKEDSGCKQKPEPTVCLTHVMWDERVWKVYVSYTPDGDNKTLRESYTATSEELVLAKAHMWLDAHKNPGAAQAATAPKRKRGSARDYGTSQRASARNAANVCHSIMLVLQCHA